MDDEIKEKLNEKFNLAKLKEEEKNRTVSEFQEKYEKIIIPAVKEFIGFFVEKGMLVIEEGDEYYIIQRNQQKFLFKWEIRGESINFQYHYIGAGLAPSPSLKKEEMKESDILEILTKFSDYILKWS